VIDGATHEFVVRPRPGQDGPDRPQGWLIKELDFEKGDEENLFQLEHATCVLGRLEAARALVKTAKAKPRVAKALAAAWKREKSAPAKREMCAVLCNGDETFLPALIEAAQGPEARVRVAAVAGLAKLNRGRRCGKTPPIGLDQSQRSLRGAQKTPCGGWLPGKSRMPTICSKQH